MALHFETFSNVQGGDTFFKAIGHPLVARKIPDLLARLREGPVAIYDPLGFAVNLGEIYDLSDLNVEGVFVQDLAEIGRSVLGQPTRPVTELNACTAGVVFVAAFDADRLIGQIGHLLPADADVASLDVVRLPDDMLTVPRNYLHPMNYGTNFAFFRESNGHHTRLVTANYWSGYGAKAPEAWCCLMDGNGAPMAEWRQSLPDAGGTIVIDSAEVRRRFALPEFTGQLFIHILNIAGHDVVKYALDTYGDESGTLSCTHDANSWPADLYAGLPAPRDDDRVVLWVQNSHPCPIPAGGVGLNSMGRAEVGWLERTIPGFGTVQLDTRELLPDARWPQQIEIRAGKHFVRPRYEVYGGNGRSRIAHANVERVDLKPDPTIPTLAPLMGKGYLLPAPILDPQRFHSTVLPTPMATCQTDLPVKVLIYDSQGREVAARALGRLARSHATAVETGALLAQGLARDMRDDANPYGHMELVYDFADGGEADGWLHGLFHYEDTKSGHAAETSFGAHIFNTALTYRGEPQSYAGRPPGLSTRLFLRLGQPQFDTLCHLIYPASTPWNETSRTILVLTAADGRAIAERQLAIPCGGSRQWRASAMFEPGELEAAGGGYVLVRDVTCRLFGYHGLLGGDGAFSLDHMFGF